MSVIDEASQIQLDYFAKSVRTAMAAAMTIIVAVKPNHELKREEVGCGIAAPIGVGEKPSDGIARVVSVMLALVDTLVAQTQEGCRVVVRLPDGRYTEPKDTGGDEYTSELKFQPPNG